jgi:hypothetical protein
VAVVSLGLIISQLGEEVGVGVMVLQCLITEVTQAPTVPLYPLPLLRHMDRHIPRLVHIQVDRNGAPTVPINILTAQSHVKNFNFWNLLKQFHFLDPKSEVVQ